MTEKLLAFAVPGARWSIQFPPAVLEFLRLHVQTSRLSKESVGQLYSKDLAASQVTIDAVTKLLPKASWFTRVRIDIAAVEWERNAKFSEGLHCLGFWHTHPEAFPTPSAADRQLAAAHAKAADAEFSGLIFVIIGMAPFPDGLGVWFHDGNTMSKAAYVT